MSKVSDEKLKELYRKIQVKIDEKLDRNQDLSIRGYISGLIDVSYMILDMINIRQSGGKISEQEREVKKMEPPLN